MVVVPIPRKLKDHVWGFIASSLERLRPIGFDGREVICLPEFKAELEATLNVSRTDET